jgi:hypothetical protein
MLIEAKTLKGSSLKGTDGDIGSVSEFYFDDRYWTIRYLVAETGSWLSDKKVLISPYSLSSGNVLDDRVNVRLTKKQIEDSPSIHTHDPVSRQFEETYNGYYGYPNYWDGDHAWGGFPYIERDHSKWGKTESGAIGRERHLRSTQEVSGYHISALDGEIGHVDDFIVDEKTWSIRYVVVATRDWWPGKKVLISPKWIQKVSWENREVTVELTRDAIKNAPEYFGGSLLTREYETGLYGHYNREGYWIDELASV